MSSRPLDELERDAAKAREAQLGQLVVTEAELRMLKDYNQVVGTADPREAWWPAQGLYLNVKEEGR